MGVSRVTYLKFTDIPGLVGERLFNLSDADKDDVLSYEEFSSAIIKLNSNESIIKMRLIFDLYDFDNCGQITKEHVISLMRHSLPSQAKPDKICIEEKSTEELSELDQLCELAFGKKGALTFEEFKKVCEEISSEMFLCPFILLKNKLPGNEQFCKFNLNIMTEQPSKLLIAAPKVLSTYKNIKSLFAEAISPSKKKVEEEEKLITFFVDNLPVCKFNRMKKRLKGKATLLNTNEQPIKESEISVCLCGKLLVNHGSSLCDECSNAHSKCQLFGSIYLLVNTLLIERFASINNKEIFIYDKDDRTKPLTVVNLVDNYVKTDENPLFSDKGKTYFGIQMSSSKSNFIFFCAADEERIKWTMAITSINKCANINEYYEVKHILGKGKFGVVRDAVNKKTGVHCAVKGLIKSKMKANDLEMIKREIEIMRLCDHPNIVKLHDYFESEQYMFIVIDFLEGSDLINYFARRGYVLKEPHCASIIIQLIKGIEYLHANNIIHRDLKGENMLLSSINDDAVLKVTDFGLSKIIGPNERCKEPYGTIGYAAPELYLQKPYDKTVDIWGIGVVAYTLLSKGHLPFDAENDSEIVALTVKEKPKFNGPEFADVSEEAKDFLSSKYVT